ncbi:MAG: hypothetical protein ACTSXW_00175 [Candidatus Baldrarchaeia archaeon]
MEIKIGELFKEAMEHPSKESIVMMSEGLEKFVLMVINALGILEEKIINLENELKSLRETVESKLEAREKEVLPAKPIQPTELKLPPSLPPVSAKPAETAAKPPAKPIEEVGVPRVVGPEEKDIEAFRKGLLKPAPKPEVREKKPVSLRDALMQELKSYFSTAMKKVHKEESEG